jgi:sensor c-di-GMP phosphodiesterase-like protein
MRTLKQRVAVVLVATLAAIAAGASAGFLLARTIVLRVSEVRLVDQATRSLAAADAYGADVREALATMNASSYPYCSDSELTYFRHILLRSQYLREGGRMTGGRIDCSTTLARSELPQERFKPVYAGEDGFQVYWDLPPFRTGTERSSVLQVGRSYVNSVIQLRNEGLPSEVTLKVALRNLAGEPANRSKPGNGTAFTEDGFRHMGDILSATHCSTNFRHCVTASISLTDAFRMGRPMFAVCMALAGLGAGVLGLFGSLTCCRKRTMEQQLRRSIRKDQLRMAYQPVVDLASGRVVGAEALARWRDERGSEVPPDVFIRLAEERGFIGQITRLAMRHVLRDLGELLRSDTGFQVSVNVTAWDLAEAGFVPMLDAALAEAAVPSERVTIEITETSTARHEKVIETIRRLRASGHRVHIDDFGTGYSSLAYLQDLSVDAIKIDKVFTQAIGTGSVSVSIVPQILAMADALDLEIVVEGIETEEQARYFCSTDRRIRAQGWLFGRPVPAGKFLEMLAEDKENEPTFVGAVLSPA